jgi:di/tricarboxylate transporter
MAVVHALERLGAFTLSSSHIEDVLLGRPIAGVLAIVGPVIAGT